MDRPGRESEQLAFTDLVNNELLIQCAEENNGIVYIYLYAVFLPKLTNVSHRTCLSVLLSRSISSKTNQFVPIHDAEEGESFSYQRMFYSH